MEMFDTSAMILMLFMVGFTHADTNFHLGALCSTADSSTINTSFQENLNNLWNSLSTNVLLHNGFYKTRVGRGLDGIYGIFQCRGDISTSDCANCTSESIKKALEECPGSRDVTLWFTWCMVRYSNQSMFGVWEKSSSMEVPGNNNGTDNAVVSSKGLSMMSKLILTAPNQYNMFQYSDIDVGQGGKRYGMAQCRRDISKSDCGKCLDSLLVSFQVTIGNQSGWEIHGMSCSLWYHDFQFYSNISTIPTSGAQRAWHGGVVAANAMATLALSTFLWLH